MPDKINIEKVKALFEKGDIEEQVEKFQELKDFINQKLDDAASVHEERQNKLLEIKGRINTGNAEIKKAPETEA